MSDEVSSEVYSETIEERFGDVELVLSCGDLPYYYLEYIVSALNVPLLYVHGNHDRPLLTESGEEIPAPRGCIDLAGRIVQVKGLLIGGLEGSPRYSPSAGYQYTESGMKAQVRRMVPRLWYNRLTKGRAIDILVTHAPPYGIHDAADPPHCGFKAFLKFMERYRPRYLIHGHTHPTMTDPRPMRYGDTEVIHVYGYKVLDIEVRPKGEAHIPEGGRAPAVLRSGEG